MAALSYCRLWSWLLQSGCTRDRFLEQGYLRRCDGENDEQHADETDGGEGELLGFTMAILFECPPFEEKDQS